MQHEQELGIRIDNWLPRQKPAHSKMIGQYCILEPLDIELHALAMYVLLNNDSGETWNYMPFGPFATFEDFKVWLNQTSVDKVVFAIIDLQTNTPQGMASYMNINIDHGSIEVGSIHYSKQLQKTRAATEAMYLMMYRIFEELGYRRYEWKCNSLNLASRQAASRLGFKFEGVFRQHCVFKGRNRDTAWFSIIDGEWPGLKNKFKKWLSLCNFDLSGRQILKLQDC